MAHETMNPGRTSRERPGSAILPRDAGYSMNIGLFSAMALVLALPTGAGGGFVLLVCSIFYLAVHRRRAGPRPARRYELPFLGSMIPRRLQ